VSANAALYQCHAFVGIDEFCIGNIYTGIDSSRTGAYLQEPTSITDLYAAYVR